MPRSGRCGLVATPNVERERKCDDPGQHGGPRRPVSGCSPGTGLRGATSGFQAFARRPSGGVADVIPPDFRTAPSRRRRRCRRYCRLPGKPRGARLSNVLRPPSTAAPLRPHGVDSPFICDLAWGLFGRDSSTASMAVRAFLELTLLQQAGGDLREIGECARGRWRSRGRGCPWQSGCTAYQPQPGETSMPVPTVFVTSTAFCEPSPRIWKRSEFVPEQGQLRLPVAARPSAL